MASFIAAMAVNTESKNIKHALTVRPLGLVQISIEASFWVFNDSVMGREGVGELLKAVYIQKQYLSNGHRWPGKKVEILHVPVKESSTG